MQNLNHRVLLKLTLKVFLFFLYY